MKTYGEVDEQLHAFLTSALDTCGAVSFMLRPLYPRGKSPWYPLDRRLGGRQGWSGGGGEEKNSLPLTGI